MVTFRKKGYTPRVYRIDLIFELLVEWCIDLQEEDIRSETEYDVILYNGLVVASIN